MPFKEFGIQSVEHIEHLRVRKRQQGGLNKQVHIMPRLPLHPHEPWSLLGQVSQERAPALLRVARHADGGGVREQVAEGGMCRKSQLGISRKLGCREIQLVERKFANLSFSLMASRKNSGFG